MNNKISIAVIALVATFVLSATSCADPDKAPTINAKELKTGVYPRLVEEGTKIFDLKKADETSYKFKVEFVSAQNGNEVSKFDIFASATTAKGTLLRSVAPSAFGTADGRKTVEETITLTEVRNLLNVANVSDIEPKSRYRIHTEITTTSGEVYNFDNTSGTLTTPIASFGLGAHFRFDITNTCPLDADKFVGTYVLSYENPTVPTGAHGKIFGDAGEEVTLEVENSTNRSVSIAYLPDNSNISSTLSLNFEFICDSITMAPLTATGTGTRCPDGSSINIAQNGKTFYDTNDDSSFKVKVKEFSPGTGSCGPEAPVTLVFTKKN